MKIIEKANWKEFDVIGRKLRIVYFLKGSIAFIYILLYFASVYILPHKQFRATPWWIQTDKLDSLCILCLNCVCYFSCRKPFFCYKVCWSRYSIERKTATTWGNLLIALNLLYLLYLLIDWLIDWLIVFELKIAIIYKNKHVFKLFYFLYLALRFVWAYTRARGRLEGSQGGVLIVLLTVLLIVIIP